MQIATLARSVVKSVQQKSPVILTGLAVAGVVSSVVLAVRATPEALKRIAAFEEKDNDLWVKATTLEKVRLVWPLYIPATSVGVVTISCIIGAQSVNTRRQAALVGAFTITEGAFQDYKDQIIESFGASKEQKVRDDLVQKQVTKDAPTAEVLVIGSGSVLCLDTYTGRYFESTMETIRRAQNDFNQLLLTGEMYASLNEFYHLLELPDTDIGEQVGFAPDNLLDINFSTAMTPDGRPCLAISFRALPRQDYYKSL